MGGEWECWLRATIATLVNLYSIMFMISHNLIILIIDLVPFTVTGILRKRWLRSPEAL